MAEKGSNQGEILFRLSPWGVTLEGLLQTASEMYVPDPALGDVLPRVKEEILKALADPNVQALVLAAVLLEEEAKRGRIPALRDRYGDDPVELLADELLGIEIAEYIGGRRALFEFYRFDRLKPGILKALPPFLDDAIGGLLAGVLVKVCS